MNRNKTAFTPADWGLGLSPGGALQLGGLTCHELAEEYGTPLHVVHEERLARTATAFLQAFRQAYPGAFDAHYAFKCNPVACVIGVIKLAGMNAEVMSASELQLALRLGFHGGDIIVNGPFKPDAVLKECLENDVLYIVVDSPGELKRLDDLAKGRGLRARVLVRLNPDVIPRGMNKGTATGSRRGCALGFDLKAGDAHQALAAIRNMGGIEFHGFHFHIGSGIRRARDYRRALAALQGIVDFAHDLGLPVRVMDIGGGFASPTSREMTTREILLYQGLGRLPGNGHRAPDVSFNRYAQTISAAMLHLFRGRPLPRLIAEPGRCITSPNQLLLLTVHQVKERPGIGTWVTTDGGIGTVTMPTLYEFHHVFLCNEVCRPLQGRVTINGPGCFAADVVYRKMRMPEMKEGEVIAIMDSGAYFTSWESAFGHPRPAVVAVNNGSARLIRRRETYDDMQSRDMVGKSHGAPAKEGVIWI